MVRVILAEGSEWNEDDSDSEEWTEPLPRGRRVIDLEAEVSARTGAESQASSGKTAVRVLGTNPEQGVGGYGHGVHGGYQNNNNGYYAQGEQGYYNNNGNQGSQARTRRFNNNKRC